MTVRVYLYLCEERRKPGGNKPLRQKGREIRKAEMLSLTHELGRYGIYGDHTV